MFNVDVSQMLMNRAHCCCCVGLVTVSRIGLLANLLNSGQNQSAGDSFSNLSAPRLSAQWDTLVVDAAAAAVVSQILVKLCVQDAYTRAKGKKVKDIRI